MLYMKITEEVNYDGLCEICFLWCQVLRHLRPSAPKDRIPAWLLENRKAKLANLENGVFIKRSNLEKFNF